MAIPGPEVLLRISEAQLHEVENARESLLEWGELVLSVHTAEGVSGVWIKVGNSEWSLDATTPTLKATSNTFMFAMGSGRFYSVLLAEGTSEEEAATLEEILAECSSFEVAGAMTEKNTEAIVEAVAHDVANDEELPVTLPQQQQEVPVVKPTTSERIISGAAMVQEKLLATANLASQKILEQTEAYQRRTEPCQKPVNISPEIARSIKIARSAAEKSNRAANRVAGGLADISIKVADSIVRHMGPTRYGQQLSDPAARPHAAKEISSAAVVAAVGIYDSMEQAARLVLNSGGEASSQFIGHKYGTAAGDVAKDAAHASVTTGLTVLSMQKVGVRKIARRIAKRTAMGLAKSYVMPGSQAGEQVQQAVAPVQLQQANGYATHYQQPVANAAAMQVGQSQPIQQAAPAGVTVEAAKEYRSPFAN